MFLLLGFRSMAQVTVTDSIYSGGIYRHYRLYVPAIYSGSQPVPLILNLHGYTSNAFQQQYYGSFMAIADTANFLVVQPDGTDPGTGQFWNAGFAGSPNDMGFLENLIDSLSAQYNIDQDRVYSTGMSNGGIMSYYLSCGLYERITAMASVTGTMTNLMYVGCNPPGPMPVMEIHGTADGTVPYNGSATSVHIDSVIKFWRIQNMTDASPVVLPYPNTSLTDGCTATEYAYLNGLNGSEVILVKITGGGHTWPGAPVDIGITNHDFSASVRIWQFFRKFSKSQLTGIREEVTDRNKKLLYPNPAGERVFVKGVKEGESFVVYDALGKTRLLGVVGANGVMDIAVLNKGVYYISLGGFSYQLVKQ